MPNASEIIWHDTAPVVSTAPTAQDVGSWGGRYAGLLGREGQSAEVLSIPIVPGQKSLGLSFYRNDSQIIRGPWTPTPEWESDAPGNSDVRARISYLSGATGNLTFDCDWRGSVVIKAARVGVEIVPYKPVPSTPFVQWDRTLFAVTAVLEPGYPSQGLTFTVPPLELQPIELPEDSAVKGLRTLRVPPLSERMTLTYGHELDDDAAFDLDGIVIEWQTLGGAVLGRLNAGKVGIASLLLGAGISVPPQAQVVNVYNKTEVQPLSIGAVFHLVL